MTGGGGGGGGGGGPGGTPGPDIVTSQCGQRSVRGPLSTDQAASGEWDPVMGCGDVRTGKTQHHLQFSYLVISRDIKRFCVCLSAYILGITLPLAIE